MSEQEVDDSQTLAVPLAELRPALEALLLVADEPMDDAQLASVVGYPVEDVSAALRSLAKPTKRVERSTVRTSASVTSSTSQPGNWANAA